MIKHRLYTYSDLQKLEAATPLVKSKIKNGKFVFNDTTNDLEFVYLGNSEDLEKAFQVPLKEIVFETPQNKLRYLDASKCNIEQIVIKNCPNLQTLYLNNNQLKSIRFEGRFGQLELINLDRNQLTELDLRISDFPELKFLYLHENKLQDLSGLAPFFINDDFDFNIQKNEGLRTPPKDTVDKGKAEIRQFFRELSKGKAAPIKDIRLILMGNTTAGKTSLADYFLGRFDPKKKDSTDGIKHYEWHPFPEDTEITVHIWDFGGQEFYHAVHSYFLTGEVVYIILWEKKTNVYIDDLVQKNIHFPCEYWIKNIQSLTQKGTSPILLVQNKIDEIPDNEYTEIPPFKEVEKPDHHISILGAFKEKMKQEQGGKLSNDETFLDEFNRFDKKLKAIIEKNLVGKIPDHWNDVKNEIQKSEDKEWTIDYYKSVCKRFDPDMDIDGCTNYLRNRGFILHYPDIKRLKDKVFIKPTEVTDKIFKILGRDKLKNNGKFSRQDVEDVLQDECDAYIDLMKAPNFELIFEYPQNTPEYVAPQYLPGEEPEYWGNYACKMDALAFAIKFPDYLPRNVMVRLISRLGKHAAKPMSSLHNPLLMPLFYKYGIVVTYQMSNNERDDVVVKCDPAEKKIKIHSKAKFIREKCIKTIHQHLLAIIRNNDEISQTFDDEVLQPLSDEILLSFDDKNFAPIGEWKRQLKRFEKTSNTMFDHKDKTGISNLCNIQDYKDLTTIIDEKEMPREEMPTHKEYINRLIKENKTGEAISQLLAGAEKSGQPDIRNEMILLSARFHANESEKQENVIERESYNVELAKIRKAVLENLKEYKPVGDFEKIPTSTSDKYTSTGTTQVFDDKPQFFMAELKSQIENEYYKILDFNEILSDTTREPLQVKYQEKIKRCEDNIKRTKALAMSNLSNVTQDIPKHTIESFINNFGNDIMERLDDIKEMIDNVQNILTEVTTSINEQEIDQNPADKQQADELLQAIRSLYDKMEKTEFPKKQELGERLNGEMSTGNKLKLIIPLIPGILQYEKDLTFNVKEPVKSWKDLWHVFVKPKKD